MLKAYRYRIYPNKEQRIIINKTIGACRFVFNYYLALRIDDYKNNNKTKYYNEPICFISISFNYFIR